MEKIDKMVIKLDGKEYEFKADGGIPAPDSVGTEQIVDDSVMLDDLNTEVKENMTNIYRESEEELTLGNLGYDE